MVYGRIVHMYLGLIINLPSTMVQYSHPNSEQQVNGVAIVDLISQFQVVGPLPNASGYYNPAALFLKLGIT